MKNALVFYTEGYQDIPTGANPGLSDGADHLRQKTLRKRSDSTTYLTYP